MIWYKKIEYCRFVLPVLPLALMFSGYCLASMSQSKGKNQHRKGSLSRLQLSVILLVITNVPMALYMSLFHQVGFPYFNIFVLLYASMDHFCCLSIISIYPIFNIHCGRGEQKMLCIICQKKPMMEEWGVFSFSCLVIQHLTTQPYITIYLCVFWTALLGGYFICFLMKKIVNLSYLYLCLNTYVPADSFYCTPW